jgi:hypothetical protein
MPHLECVNEEFKHYFIVDTPPSSFRDRKGNPTFKRKKIKIKTIYSKLKTLLNSFLVVIV